MKDFALLAGSSGGAHAFPREKIQHLRNCFESAMDFQTAMGCAGFYGESAERCTVLHRMWNGWQAIFDA